jgi:hypothetical protein
VDAVLAVAARVGVPAAAAPGAAAVARAGDGAAGAEPRTAKSSMTVKRTSAPTFVVSAKNQSERANEKAPMMSGLLRLLEKLPIDSVLGGNRGFAEPIVDAELDEMQVVGAETRTGWQAGRSRAENRRNLGDGTRQEDLLVPEMDPVVFQLRRPVAEERILGAEAKHSAAMQDVAAISEDR